MSSRWFTDTYCDAVWESSSLCAAEKAVAETYARHARDDRNRKSATADMAWLTYERLMELAGFGRRASVAKAVASLVAAGWLKPVRQIPRRATVYQLIIPVGSSDGGTTELGSGSSDGGTTVVPFSSEATVGSSDGGTTVVPTVERNLSSKVQKKLLSPAASPPKPVQAREREVPSSKPKTTPSSIERAVADSTLTDDQKPRFVAWATAEHTVRSATWWRTAHRNGDIPLLVEKFEAYEETQRRSGPCPEHGRSGRISYCYECRTAYDAHDFYLQHPGFTVEQAAAYLRCPEHIDHDIGTCPECRCNRGDAAYWMTHDQADVPPHNPNQHGPSTNQRHAVRHSHDSLNN